MERAEFEALSDSGLDVLGDKHGAGEFLAAVEHSVADSTDLIGRGDNAVLGVNERIEHKLDGCAVIGDGAGEILYVFACVVGHLVGEGRICIAYLFADALCKELVAVGINELIFER